VKAGPLVVVGDTLLDVDLHGTAGRLAPDAPVPVIDCASERHRAGGAGLAAVLAAAAGGAVVLITALGTDRHGQRLRDLLAPRLDLVALPLTGGTPCKVRIHASGQPVARLDAGAGRAAPGPAGPAAGRILRQAGAVLVSDYGRGVTAHPALRSLLGRLPASVPVVWDPHPRGERPLAGCRLVTPNRGEARGFAAALGVPAAPAGGVIGPAAHDAAALSQAWRSPVAVTLGAGGALLCTGESVPFVAPAAPVTGPVDTCGAGDCFAAAAAQVLRAGGLLTEAVTEAVHRAGRFVSRGGAGAAPGLTVPGPAQPGPGEPADDVTDAFALAARVRERGGKVVATGGCFDLLHAGHVRLLQQARGLGDCLVVCLNSDASVRALKGPGRPLTSASDRARILAALACVDAVVVFDEPDPATVLARLRPDVWVKGGDYALGELAEAGVVRAHGGEVVLLPYLARRSTSAIVAAAREG